MKTSTFAAAAIIGVANSLRIQSVSESAVANDKINDPWPTLIAKEDGEPIILYIANTHYTHIDNVNSKTELGYIFGADKCKDSHLTHAIS